MATLTSRLIVALTDRVSGPARGVGASLDRLAARARRTNGAFMGPTAAFGGGFLRGAVAVGAGYIGVSKAIGGTVGAAIKFEEAFADVRKVVDGTPGQLAKIRSEIVGLSKELPVTADGIAAIYAAAGQSNIPMQELGKFAEMAAKVSVAWDTSQGETGDALAKIKTQLGLNVDQLGLYADAINQLSNNTAAAAPDLVDFAKRVAANGKMFGFTATQTLAFGSAMVSSGAQSQVAATSFRNMGRALTKGTQATKMQRGAFAKLGLDAVKTAKKMQKDALGTTLDVIERIQALPEWQQISIASALFGDEARALMPVIGNTAELRRQLGLVASDADYAGSAFREYMVRAETTANALQILWNKIRGVGIDIGDSWLPTVKEFALGIGDVLDTLKSRVGIFDQIKASVSGLMTGFGYGGDGGVRALMNDLGDILFGEAFDSENGYLVDERVSALARLSNRFRDIGRNVRSFADDLGSGDVAAAAGSLGNLISNLSGSLTVGGAIAIGIVGRGLLAVAGGAVALARSPIGRIAFAATAISALIDAVKDANSLGEFISNLEDLSTIQWVAIAAGLTMLAGPLGRIAGSLGLIKKAGGVAAVARGASATGVGAAAAGAGAGIAAPAALAAGSVLGTAFVLREMDADVRAEDRRLATHRGAERSSMAAYMRDRAQIDDMIANRNGGSTSSGGFLSGLHALDDWLTSKFPSLKANTGEPAEVTVTEPIETRPGGTQDVRVTNPMPAPVINITVNAETNADPQAIAAQTERVLSEKMNALSRGAYSDGAN